MILNSRRVDLIFHQSAVILSANVGLLAIQSVDNSIGSSMRSAAQISSYMSTLLSMGNIITGTILARQHRTHNRVNDPTDGVSGYVVLRSQLMLKIRFSGPVLD